MGTKITILAVMFFAVTVVFSGVIMAEDGQLQPQDNTVNPVEQSMSMYAYSPQQAQDLASQADTQVAYLNDMYGMTSTSYYPAPATTPAQPMPTPYTPMPSTSMTTTQPAQTPPAYTAPAMPSMPAPTITMPPASTPTTTPATPLVYTAPVTPSIPAPTVPNTPLMPAPTTTMPPTSPAPTPQAPAAPTPPGDPTNAGDQPGMPVEENVPGNTYSEQYQHIMETEAAKLEYGRIYDLIVITQKIIADSQVALKKMIPDLCIAQNSMIRSEAAFADARLALQNGMASADPESRKLLEKTYYDAYLSMEVDTAIYENGERMKTYIERIIIIYTNICKTLLEKLRQVKPLV